eukprot:UN15729
MPCEPFCNGCKTDTGILKSKEHYILAIDSARRWKSSSQLSYEIFRQQFWQIKIWQ